MRRIVRNALLLAGVIGAAVAVRGYLARGTAVAEGEAQIHYSDGSMGSLNPPESEEVADIARKLIETGL